MHAAIHINPGLGYLELWRARQLDAYWEAPQEVEFLEPLPIGLPEEFYQARAAAYGLPLVTRGDDGRYRPVSFSR